MQLSDHFSLEEMAASQEATRRGIDNTPPIGIIGNLRATCQQAEAVRALLGAPMLVSSGYRCAELNAAVGGVADSAHVQGWAMDFICPAVGTPLEVCQKIEVSGIKYDQIITEGTWCHLSFAPTMRQQQLTAKFTKDGATYTEGLGV